MNKIRYFIYDIENGFSNKEITIKEFEFDNKTLIWEFYKELLTDYVSIHYGGADKMKDLFEMLSFVIEDNINGRFISAENGDKYFYKIVNDIKDKLLCIMPIFPIGGIVAMYNEDKLVIHMNEDNHLRFPHIHVITSEGLESVIDLRKIEICEGVILRGKEKKKILNYIKERQNYLINLYTDIINHKEILSIEIEKI